MILEPKWPRLTPRGHWPIHKQFPYKESENNNSKTLYIGLTHAGSLYLRLLAAACFDPWIHAGDRSRDSSR